MNDSNDYLYSSELIDYLTPAVQIKADELARGMKSEKDLLKRIYLFVRDDIAHSNDIEADELTASASDVLCAGHGLCYAKAHLFAALCRYHKIPCALCYQRIRSGDGIVLHGLNAVWLREEQRWARLDARGNKNGINADFSMKAEKLAYEINASKGEEDVEGFFADTPASVADFLTKEWALDEARLAYPDAL